MFTGLIQERGQILGLPRASGQGGVRLQVGLSRALAAGLGTGASLAVSGVCLTVIEVSEVRPGPAARSGSAGERAHAAHQAMAVVVELAPETLARTTLGGLRDGAWVNLEPPLRAGEPLGGHLVQGHVDGTAAVVSRRDLAEHRVLELSLPAPLVPFLVEKGSVCVDGVSLTVAALAPDAFEVALLPHTLAVTTLGGLVPGDTVNLEVDVLAKYVHRMLSARGLAPPSAPLDAAAPNPSAGPVAMSAAPGTAGGSVAPEAASGSAAPEAASGSAAPGPTGGAVAPEAATEAAVLRPEAPAGTGASPPAADPAGLAGAGPSR